MSRQKRAPRPVAGRAAAVQLGPGVWARVRYRVFDAEGEAVEGGDSELGFVFGFGAVLPALEAALAGATAGSTRSVVLEPRDAFGMRVAGAELDVSREEFPPGVEAGDRFELEREDGTLQVARVLDVSEEHVLLDLNHPLAGQRVRFEVAVVEARPASAEEIALAEAALEPKEDEPEAQEGLISPASLLRRGVRS